MDYVDINDIIAGFIDVGCTCKKQLRYLLYYYKAWGLALYDINIRENVLAHINGPLFASYHEKCLRYKDTKELKESLYGYGELTSDENELLEQVYITYGDKTYNELMCLSRGETPWIIANLQHKDYQSPYGNIIDEMYMKNYYYGLYKNK